GRDFHPLKIAALARRTSKNKYYTDVHYIRAWPIFKGFFGPLGRKFGGCRDKGLGLKDWEETKAFSLSKPQRCGRRFSHGLTPWLWTVVPSGRIFPRQGAKAQREG
ncbi:MAG: hypothetical protein JXB10_08835, partial [Pirellulales bacterium]|nr:hypothetical protein [Pirellulales bacterium]